VSVGQYYGMDVANLRSVVVHMGNIEVLIRFRDSDASPERNGNFVRLA
jgi:hypothetical protein